jgi:hypothetical protein
MGKVYHREGWEIGEEKDEIAASLLAMTRFELGIKELLCI